MKITRDHFVDQFAISIGVHSLAVWHKRSRSPPVHVARSIFETMRMCAGSIPITSAAFGVIVDPVIAELHRRTPKGQRPDAKELTGLGHDALDKAGVEVTISSRYYGHGAPVRRNDGSV